MRTMYYIFFDQHSPSSHHEKDKNLEESDYGTSTHFASKFFKNVWKGTTD